METTVLELDVLVALLLTRNGKAEVEDTLKLRNQGSYSNALNRLHSPDCDCGGHEKAFGREGREAQRRGVQCAL